MVHTHEVNGIPLAQQAGPVTRNPPGGLVLANHRPANGSEITISRVTELREGCHSVSDAA
jgi:hypothetical protein